MSVQPREAAFRAGFVGGLLKGRDFPKENRYSDHDCLKSGRSHLPAKTALLPLDPGVSGLDPEVLTLDPEVLTLDPKVLSLDLEVLTLDLGESVEQTKA